MIHVRRFLIGVVLLLAIPHLAFAVQEQYADCRICHKYFAAKKTVHPPALASCVSCHTEPHRKWQTHAKGLSKEGALLCYQCHNKAEFADEPQKMLHAPINAGHPMGSCTRCHNPHSSDNAKLLEEPVPRLCNGCHNEKKFSGKSVHAPVAKGMCLSCHFPHQSRNKRLLKATAPQLCFLCHSEAAFNGRVKHPVVANGKCSFCHSPHASAGIFLLDGPVNEVCAKCHKRPHVKGTMARHSVSRTKDPQRKGREFGCTSCHDPHSSNSPNLFRYTINSDREACRYCHKDR